MTSELSASDIIAIYGAILATVLGARQFLHERAAKRFLAIEKYYNGADKSEPFGSYRFQITNRNSMNVTVTDIRIYEYDGIIFRGTSLLPWAIKINKANPKLPILIKPGEFINYYVGVSQLIDTKEMTYYELTKLPKRRKTRYLHVSHSQSSKFIREKFEVVTKGHEWMYD